MKIKRFILSFLFSLLSLSQFWEGRKQKHTGRLPIVSSVCRHGGARGQAGEGAGGARRQAGGGRRGLGRAALRELQRRGHRERQRGGRLSFREVRGRAQTPASRHHQPPAARQDSCSWKQFAAANSPINRLARGWAGLGWAGCWLAHHDLEQLTNTLSYWTFYMLEIVFSNFDIHIHWHS